MCGGLFDQKIQPSYVIVLSLLNFTLRMKFKFLLLESSYHVYIWKKNGLKLNIIPAINVADFY